MFPHSSLRKRLAICVITLFWLSVSGLAKTPDYRLDDDGSQSRKNGLSREAIHSLRAAFLGREFVIRINWSANHIVHDGQVKHESETYASASAQRKASKRGIEYGALVSPAGEVSTITGMNFMHPHDVYLHFRTSRGSIGSLVVRSEIRGKSTFKKWEDNLLTPQWLEAQLTNQSLRFLKASKPLNTQAVAATLPQAQSGLRLSSNPFGGTTASEPEIRRVSQFPLYLDALSVRVEPPRVQKGQYVRLIIDYEIAGEGNGGVEAIESRYLSFNDNSLPGYPVVKAFERSIGPNESVYRQRIPSSARSGSYTFKGEVVVNGESISRIVQFTVAD